MKKAGGVSLSAPDNPRSRGHANVQCPRRRLAANTTPGGAVAGIIVSAAEKHALKETNCAISLTMGDVLLSNTIQTQPLCDFVWPFGAFPCRRLHASLRPRP
jgi:hypothetical protein